MNLSIIILVCNEAKTIADCLGSILSQLTQKLEVLLADYGSDDGTMKVVALAGGFVEFHRMNPLPQQAVFRRKTVGAYRIRPDVGENETAAPNIPIIGFAHSLPWRAYAIRPYTCSLNT